MPEATQLTPLFLIGLALLAYASTGPARIRPASSQHFQGWQKLFCGVAFVLAALILINPELLALGLLGDTAFFDVLVLLISLQLQSVVVRAWRVVCATFSRMMAVMIPRLSRDYSLMILAFAPVGEMVSAIQKALHRNSLYA